MASPLTAPCPACNAFNPYTQALCSQCQARLPWAEALAEARLAGEQQGYETGYNAGSLGSLQDSAERQQREHQLQEAEQRFALMFERSPIPQAISTWAEGCFVEANAAYLALMGRTREELIGHTAQEIGIWTNYGDRATLLRELQAQGIVNGLELTVQAQPGQLYHVLANIVALDYEGQRCLLSFLQDITERKQVERSLRESEERFRLAARATNEAIWDWDLKANTIWWGEGFQVLFGYRPQIESEIESWRSRLHPDDAEWVPRSIDAAIESGAATWAAEYRFRRADDSYADILDRGYMLYDEMGKPIRMVGSMLDITERKFVEQSLQQAESQYRSIFENAVEGIFQTTPEGQYIAANPALARIYNYESPEDMTSRITDIADQLYVEPGRRAEFARLLDEQDYVTNFESAIRRKDGSVIWISENARVLRADDGRLIGYEGTVMDITERKEAAAERRKAEAALRLSETRLRDIVEHSSNLFYTRTPDQIFTYLSPQTRQFLDCEPDAALQHWEVFMTDNPLNRVGVEVAQRAVATGQAQPVYNLELVGTTGRKVFVEVNEAPVVRDGQTVAIVGALVDITQRHAIEQQLKHQAFHDALTNLPNRLLFMDRLEHALTRLQRHEGAVAVLFLDLDRFKIINDSLGHEVGDQLLQAAAARLTGCLRPDDTVARLGGDEFTILMEDSNVKDAILIAERIVAEFQHPFMLKSQEVFVTTSVGIALSQVGGTVPEDLLRDADVAMYRAKAKGRAQYEVFDPDMNARAMERLTLETDLWQAVGRDELRVYYQPLVELATGHITGVEALVRWQHPQHGLVPPGEFIPLSEETGIILSIGQWVLSESCRQAQFWMQQGLTSAPLQISVNISARQLQQPTLAQEVAAVLQETGLPPHLLKLEITESVIMGDAEHAIAMLRELKALGIHLAIDDFGTGYSSLSYLRRFPMDTLKIDRAFINNLGIDHEDTEIVRAVITLAQTLGLSVTAEGIETAGQLEQLKTLGCDCGQGYFFAKPLPSDALHALLSLRNKLGG